MGNTIVAPKSHELASFEYPDPDQNPAVVYLASLSSPRSRRTMRHALRSIVAALSGHDLREVSDENTLAFPWHELRHQHTAFIRAKLQEKYSSGNTVNRILSALRQVLKEAWRLGYMTNEEMARATDIENVSVQVIPAGRDLSQGEIIGLVEACRADKNAVAGARDTAIIGLLYTCGVRRAELASLELENINRETGAIKVLHGKGKKQRTVYATNGTLAALGDWLAVRGPEPGALFLPVRKGGALVARKDSETGKLKGITAQTIYDMLARRGKQAGVPDFSPHDFRRTFVGDLLDRGVDISTVQHLAGHASVTTTARYDRRPETVKLEAAQKLHFPYSRRND